LIPEPSSAAFFSGLALVQLGETEASVNARAYDQEGHLLEEVQKILGAKEKWVSLVRDMFQTPSQVRTVVFTSTHPMCGFQLQGDLNQQFLMGCLSQ
jgi:hypothetical protein